MKEADKEDFRKIEPSMPQEIARELHWHLSRNWISYLINIVEVLAILTVALFATHTIHC